mgnify:CR=1 FL=1
MEKHEIKVEVIETGKTFVVSKDYFFKNKDRLKAVSEEKMESPAAKNKMSSGEPSKKQSNKSVKS